LSSSSHGRCWQQFIQLRLKLLGGCLDECTWLCYGISGLDIAYRRRRCGVLAAMGKGMVTRDS
ncbi:TPA: hypothetical protein ACVHP3_004460, partial [Yersinia enterocolitica]